MDLSQAAFAEIRKKLQDAGYGHALGRDSDGRLVLDMHGIAVAAEPAP